MQNLSAIEKYSFLFFSTMQIHATVKTNKNTDMNTK